MEAGQEDAKASNVISFRRFMRARRTKEAQRWGGIPRRRQPLTTPLFRPSALETAVVPPSASMVDPAVKSDMVNYIVRYWRTCQEFANAMTTNSEFGVLISFMREKFKDQARRLEAVRIAIGFDTQAALVKELNISKGTWSDLESGTKPLSLEMARIFKARWHLPLDFLLDGDVDALEQAPARIVRKLEELSA